MSVYLDGTADTLRILDKGSNLDGSGDISMGAWVYLPSLPGANRDIMWIAPSATLSANYFGFIYRTADNTFHAFGTTAAETDTGTPYSISAATWYWVDAIRDFGGSWTCRIFDDSTSTTPLGSLTHGDDSANWSGMDSILIGQATNTDPSCIMKIVNPKVHTGVLWSAAQSRTEARYYGIQTAGGSDRLCWRFNSIAATTDGINEIAGAGPNFTNSGAITDAGVPTNLSEFGSSTPLGRSAQLNTTQGRPVQLRPTGINPLTFVR